jgi:integrase
VKFQFHDFNSNDLGQHFYNQQNIKYLFNYLFNYHLNYRSLLKVQLFYFNKNLNIGLKTVGKAVGINDLEFYQARHTFATLSRNLMKFSKGDVDEALNHVGSFEVADIYIVKDFSIINDNNFKLIKKVFKKELA